MFRLGEITFGDTVRIDETEWTRGSGHAGLIGVCFGVTTPSVTSVDVVGDTSDDVALNVHFESDPELDAWFAPDLVVLVDRAAGSVATVGERSFVKTEQGDWLPASPEDESRSQRR